ncbi:MAG: hypothetical protein GWN41_04180 [Phycisphaerae bacterium]|nr:hypothetical protein [Phycisphaerae bacterium]
MGLLLSELQRALKMPFDLMKIGYFTLFAMTGVLIFFWIWATDKELELLFRLLDPKKYAAPSGIRETLIILSLALLLVILLFASRNPLWYSSIFVIYNTLNWLGGRRQQEELSQVFTKSKERALPDLKNQNYAEKAALYIKVIQTLESYFIKRPHGRRLKLAVFCSVIGLALSISWFATKMQVFGFGAYVVLIVTITLSEFTIWHWRSIRNTELRPIIEELNELVRATEEDNGENS